jgi:hypothetical protein
MPGLQRIRIDQAYIRRHTIEHVRGNRKRAAQILGLSLRTLQNRIAAQTMGPALCGEPRSRGAPARGEDYFAWPQLPESCSMPVTLNMPFSPED